MGARNYDDGVAQRFFEQPILNSPYEYPARHWELDENRQPTEQIVDRRRTVSFITPVPAARKRRTPQPELGVDDVRGAADGDGQQYELMRMIESVRHSVNEWRRLPRAQWRVTPETARLATAARTPRTRRPPWTPAGYRASAAPAPTAAGPSQSSPTSIHSRTILRPLSGYERRRGSGTAMDIQQIIEEIHMMDRFAHEEDGVKPFS